LPAVLPETPALVTNGAHAVAAQRVLKLRGKALVARQAVARGEAVAESEDMNVLRLRLIAQSGGHDQQQRVDKAARRPILRP
jgi:flagella basal body P-ring formation protein FlgA